MNSGTVSHLHLLLNHVPTVGLVAGVGLLLLGLARRNEHLKHASLEVLFIVGLLTLPVYFTGVAAGAEIEGMSGVDVGSIDIHENAALLAFSMMQMVGLVAWFGLWQYRRLSRPPGFTLGAVLLLSVITVTMMGRAATLGGEIRHPEIRAGEATDSLRQSTSGLLSAQAVEALVSDYPWIWPAAETLHFLGLCLAFGVLLSVNLRVLGAMKTVSFAALHRLLPWGVLGFGLNLITGMIFFVSAASQYTTNVAFFWKVIFLVFAGAHFLYLTVFSGTWRLEPGEEAQRLDKLIAGGAVCAWVGVIYWGRMLPFIGNAF